MAKTGTILLFAGNKVPKDWHWCDGTSMSISSNTPLFVTLRTEFGGDGARAFGDDLARRATVFGGGRGGVLLRYRW